MAISFVAADAYAGDDASNNVILPKPTGTSEDDVLVCLVQSTQSASFTNPSGWTTLDTWDASSGVRCRTAYKVAGGSEPSSYTFQLGTGNGSASGTIMAFSGVDTSSPVRDNATNNGVDTSLSSPALTGTQSDDMVFIAGGGRPESTGDNDFAVNGPTTGGWTSPAAAFSDTSNNAFGFGGCSDSSYQTDGGTGTFTASVEAGFATAAVSLIAAATSTSHELTGTITSASSASADLTTTENHELTGTLTSVSATDSALANTYALSGSLGSTSALTGEIVLFKVLEGTVSSTSSVGSASLTNEFTLSGTSSSTSSTEGGLDANELPFMYPSYQFFIDWDHDGGLRVNDFNNTFEGWEGHGTHPPDLSLSTTQAFSGDQSLLIDWNLFLPFTFDDEDKGFDNGQFGVFGLGATTDPFTFDDADLGFDEGNFANDIDPIEVVSSYASFKLTGLVVGRQYHFSMYLYPIGNHVHYKIGINGVAISDPTTTLGAWQEVTVDFVPTAEEMTVFVHPENEPQTDDELYVDYITIKSQFEEVVPQNAFDFAYGRDNSRALSPVTPADTSLEFLDLNGRYSPLNRNSELFPNVEAGREVQIRATFNGQYYDLFWGLLDDVDLNPETGQQNATFDIVDIMSFLGQTRLDTEVYSGKRTGEVINIILDIIGWPKTRRDIDAGATVIDRWWGYNVDASDAISEVVASEGTPAYATLGPTGDFVFRDRHHRLLAARSNNSQAVYSSLTTEAEPLFSPPMELNLGWKDVINSVKLETTPRRGQKYFTERVWSSEEIRSINAGHTEAIEVVAENPFIHARTPVDRSDPFADRFGIPGGDYTLLQGTVNVFLSRTSGQTTTIFIQNTGATTAVVQDMSLYAVPIVQEDDEKQQITLKDATSISRIGRESSQDIETPWANVNDARAISHIIVGQRSNTLATVSITLNNGANERTVDLLSRRLSDRIKIKEPRSFINHEFYVESIEHSVDAAGKYHECKLGCEQIPVYDEDVNPFKFDDADAGFDEGVFGYDGLSESGTLFVLDETDLDEGLLAF